jgi:hypothetical protein
VTKVVERIDPDHAPLGAEQLIDSTIAQIPDAELIFESLWLRSWRNHVYTRIVCARIAYGVPLVVMEGLSWRVLLLFPPHGASQPINHCQL